ncbi:MAG: hypothetical protein HY781_02895 [Chloroflexi bacterium]|nr:hypothetical protein [Chloroflexota bacterium]
MRKFFTGVARFLAGIFAILFVITAVLALILFNLGRQLFNANPYKNALSDLNVYETLPALVGRILTSGISINPCAENPITCEDISPELRACYEQAFGEERYVALASGQDQPTDSESQAVQSCLDQYGESNTTGNEENKLQTASPEVQDCVRQAVGETAYNELYSNQRPPTEAEQQQVQTCFGDSGSGDSAGEGGMPPFFQNLTAEDWEAILRIIVPPDEMKAMVESILDGVFAYLDGEVDQVTVSLVSLKDRLAGPAGEDLILQIITSQPTCTEEEMSQLTGTTSSEGMVLCNPPEEMLPLVVPVLQQQLKDVLLQIPDEAVIIKPYAPDSSSSGGGPLGNAPIAAIRIIRLILRLIPLLPLVFLLLVTLFGVRSLKGWMRWWGIPFFFTGGITLGLGIAAAPALTRAWNTFIEPRIPAFLTADVANLGRDFVQYIAQNLTERIVFQSLVLLIVGLAAWIGSYFIKAKTGQEETLPPTSPIS